MSRSIRNEATANELLASTVRTTTQDAYGATAYDRVGRNALTYKPSLRTHRTAAKATPSRIIARVLNALF
jgi:hypothetical protein